MEPSDFSLITLVLNASIIVQFVMLLLLIASIWSWVIIFSKFATYQEHHKEARRFENEFALGTDLPLIYNTLNIAKTDVFGMSNIFTTGFRAFSRLKKSGFENASVLDGCNRAMRVVVNKEIDRLETGLSFLATVGSTSPYVGLFGTVWGIMNSFRSLGEAGNATLAMVAPGISEALIATAMGLFAAIPAVIFYNRFTTDTQRLSNKYETFAEELSAILQHKTIK